MVLVTVCRRSLVFLVCVDVATRLCLFVCMFRSTMTALAARLWRGYRRTANADEAHSLPCVWRRVLGLPAVPVC